MWPVRVNVCENVPPGVMWPESNESPVTLATSWSKASLLVHVTVSPASSGQRRRLEVLAGHVDRAGRRVGARGRGEGEREDGERAPHFFTR